MELDEIKSAWNDLNTRLEKTEKLNRKLLEEMLHTKQQTAKDKLMKYEVSFMIFSFVFALLTPLTYFAKIYTLSTTLLFELVFVVAGIWQIYKIYLLNQMKIDQCPTAELLRKAIRFRVITKLRTVIGLTLLIPIFVLIFVFDKGLIEPPVLIGMIAGGCIGIAIGLVFFFKNLKDVDSLVKSYKEINELEKDEQ